MFNNPPALPSAMLHIPCAAQVWNTYDTTGEEVLSMEEAISLLCDLNFAFPDAPVDSLLPPEGEITLKELLCFYKGIE